MRRDEIRLYNIWRNMKSRCKRPRASHGEKHYESITYCQEWEKYEPFEEWAMQNGYNDTLTIERNDSSKDYKPSNCSWATHKQQANNTKRNTFIEYKGETKTIAQWAEHLGMKYNTLISRLQKDNWTVEMAFEAPLGFGLNKDWKWK